MPLLACDTADSLDARQLEEPAPQRGRLAGQALQLIRLAVGEPANPWRGRTGSDSVRIAPKRNPASTAGCRMESASTTRTVRFSPSASRTRRSARTSLIRIAWGRKTRYRGPDHYGEWRPVGASDLGSVGNEMIQRVATGESPADAEPSRRKAADLGSPFF